MSEAGADRRERCVKCQTPLDPRAETVRLELDSSSSAVGLSIGHLCLSCGQEMQEQIDQSDDDYGSRHP